MTKAQACTAKSVRVKAQDLPLCCPQLNQRIWDAHPRVYLAIEDAAGGEIDCPYCATHYTLVEAE